MSGLRAEGDRLGWDAGKGKGGVEGKDEGERKDGDEG